MAASLGNSMSITAQLAIGIPLSSEFESNDYLALTKTLKEYTDYRAEIFKSRSNAQFPKVSHAMTVVDALKQLNEWSKLNPLVVENPFDHSKMSYFFEIHAGLSSHFNFQMHPADSSNTRTTIGVWIQHAGNVYQYFPQYFDTLTKDIPTYVGPHIMELDGKDMSAYISNLKSQLESLDKQAAITTVHTGNEKKIEDFLVGFNAWAEKYEFRNNDSTEPYFVRFAVADSTQKINRVLTQLPDMNDPKPTFVFTIPFDSFTNENLTQLISLIDENFSNIINKSRPKDDKKVFLRKLDWNIRMFIFEHQYQEILKSGLVDRLQMKELIDKMDKNDETAEDVALKLYSRATGAYRPVKKEGVLKPVPVYQNVSADKLLDNTEDWLDILRNKMVTLTTVTGLLKEGRKVDLDEMPSIKSNFEEIIALRYIQDHLFEPGRSRFLEKASKVNHAMNTLARPLVLNERRPLRFNELNKIKINTGEKRLLIIQRDGQPDKLQTLTVENRNGEIYLNEQILLNRMVASPDINMRVQMIAGKDGVEIYNRAQENFNLMEGEYFDLRSNGILKVLISDADPKNIKILDLSVRKTAQGLEVQGSVSKPRVLQPNSVETFFNGNLEVLIKSSNDGFFVGNVSNGAKVLAQITRHPSYAMTSNPAMAAPGGIDLTAKRMNLEVAKDKGSISQPMDLKILDNIRINGLYIKDIEIKPLKNLPEMLGVTPSASS